MYQTMLELTQPHEIFTSCVKNKKNTLIVYKTNKTSFYLLHQRHFFRSTTGKNENKNGHSKIYHDIYDNLPLSNNICKWPFCDNQIL